MTGWPVWKYNCYELSLFSNKDLAIHAKYIKIPQSLVITNFNRMNASENQRCIALPFVISRMSLLYAVSWSVLSVFLHCASPLMTPSSPNTKPWPLHLRMWFDSKSRSVRVEFCFQGLGQRLTGDTRLKKCDEAHSNIIPQSCKNAHHSSSHL